MPKRLAFLLRSWLIDPWLVIALALLAAFGLSTLYAAVHHGDLGIWHRQAAFWIVGIGMLVAIAALPLRFWAYLAWPAYSLCLLLLALLPWIGEVRMGARRWIDLGLISLQPSELMKWALILALAHLLASRESPSGKIAWAALAMIAAPCALIAAQPDLGTAVVVAAIGMSVLFAAGLSWRWLLGLAATAVLFVPIAWKFLLHDYQRQRVLTFLHPERDPLGAGYHVLQSKIAIGSGGIFGKGWLQGTQARLHFLPEQHTDFIFAVLAEEGGLLAAGALLAIYGLLLFRLLAIAERAPTRFGALITVGVAAVLFVNITVNIGMTSGLLPVVGVPLPFVSYGGSALISMLASVGLAMRTAADAKVHPPWQRPTNPFAG